MPIDKEHRQYDQPGQAGHMTVVGCQLWAKNMFSFIKEVLRAKKNSIGLNLYKLNRFSSGTPESIGTKVVDNVTILA